MFSNVIFDNGFGILGGKVEIFAVVLLNVLVVVVLNLPRGSWMGCLSWKIWCFTDECVLLQGSWSSGVTQWMAVFEDVEVEIKLSTWVESHMFGTGKCYVQQLKWIIELIDPFLMSVWIHQETKGRELFIVLKLLSKLSCHLFSLHL